MATIINFPNAAPDPISAAKALTKTASAADVRKVLKLAVEANLDPLEQGELIAIIVERTKFKARDVRQTLKALLAEAQLSIPDEPQALAIEVLEKVYLGQLRVGPDSRCWRFTGTHWVMAPDTEIKKALNTAFRDPSSSYGGKTKPTVDAALSILKDMCGGDVDPTSDGFAKQTLINCTNGELHLGVEQPELRPHNPKSGLIYAPTVQFDPAADCPKFKAALADIFSLTSNPKDMIRHVFELIGYAVRPIRNRPTIMVFHGVGANGKSSLLRVIRAVIGEPQVYANSISLLSRDRFAVAGLAGKLVWIDDDVKNDIVLDDGMLKTISEAKALTARRAYGRLEFTFRVMALPILATNNIPRINDASYGFERRLMVVPFDRKFEKHEIDLALFDEIIASELSGILNEALAGAKRLEARNDFDLPVDCVKARDMFFAHSNALRGFAKERLIASPEKRVALRDVYDALIQWCSYNHVPRPFARNQLKSKLEGAGFRVTKSTGVMCVRDVDLNPIEFDG
jgi:putative DNA primase/helicase